MNYSREYHSSNGHSEYNKDTLANARVSSNTIRLTKQL